MKKKISIGLIIGTIAGVLDSTPMIVQHLTWDANLSAFSLWVVSGILISTIDWKMKPVLKGIIIPFIILIPTAILIAWKEPVSLIPIVIMALILGSLSGILIDKLVKRLL